jgi:hypothetical protein
MAAMVSKAERVTLSQATDEGLRLALIDRNTQIMLGRRGRNRGGGGGGPCKHLSLVVDLGQHAWYMSGHWLEHVVQTGIGQGSS